MTVNDVNQQSSSDVPVRSLRSIFNEMYPGLARSDPVPDGWYTGLIRWRPYSNSTEYQSMVVPVYAQSRTPDRSVNHESVVQLPRHSAIDFRRSQLRLRPMVNESPDARAAPANQGSLESPSPEDATARGSSNHPREDIAPPPEWEARILVNVINFVGSCLLDMEEFSRGDYQACDLMIRGARELASLETEEGKNTLLYLCAWHHSIREDDHEDRRLAAFAVERFRRKHNGPLGDHMSARRYNRYLGFMWIIDGILMCCDNDDPLPTDRQ